MTIDPFQVTGESQSCKNSSRAHRRGKSEGEFTTNLQSSKPKDAKFISDEPRESKKENQSVVDTQKSNKKRIDRPWSLNQKYYQSRLQLKEFYNRVCLEEDDASQSQSNNDFNIVQNHNHHQSEFRAMHPFGETLDTRTGYVGLEKSKIMK